MMVKAQTGRPGRRKTGGRSIALAVSGVMVLILAAKGGIAQDETEEPGTEPPRSGPVRIVPQDSGTRARPDDRDQADAPQRDVTVNLDGGFGQPIAAGSPLWIIDEETNRLIACDLERTSRDQRIVCYSRPLP